MPVYLQRAQRFWGEVTDAGFVIHRNKDYQKERTVFSGKRNRNPILFKGSFEKVDSKTRINTTARFHTVTNIYFGLFIGLLLFMYILPVFAGRSPDFILLIVFTALCIFLPVSFWIEFPRTLEDFKKAIE